MQISTFKGLVFRREATRSSDKETETQVGENKEEVQGSR